MLNALVLILSLALASTIGTVHGPPDTWESKGLDLSTIEEAKTELKINPCGLTVVICQHEFLEKADIENLIRALALEYGVNPNTAVRIAKCESKLDPNEQNPESTAKGIFQFLDGTWHGYGKGDVFNLEDNTRSFMRVYPLHPTWWECR